MSHNRDRAIFAAFLIVALALFVIATWQCGKRLGRALEARQSAQATEAW